MLNPKLASKWFTALRKHIPVSSVRSAIPSELPAENFTTEAPPAKRLDYVIEGQAGVDSDDRSVSAAAVSRSSEEAANASSNSESPGPRNVNSQPALRHMTDIQSDNDRHDTSRARERQQVQAQLDRLEVQFQQLLEQASAPPPPASMPRSRAQRAGGRN